MRKNWSVRNNLVQRQRPTKFMHFSWVDGTSVNVNFTVKNTCDISAASEDKRSAQLNRNLIWREGGIDFAL